MKRITEVPVTPDEGEDVLAEATIQSVTEWPALNQVRRIEFLSTDGRRYRIDVGEFVRIEEAEVEEDVIECQACGNKWPREQYEELRPIDASDGYCPSCGEMGEVNDA